MKEYVILGCPTGWYAPGRAHELLRSSRTLAAAHRLAKESCGGDGVPSRPIDAPCVLYRYLGDYTIAEGRL
jgi:hypothetical protein